MPRCLFPSLLLIAVGQLTGGSDCCGAILDSVSTNAAAAYSLRLLRSEYTGPAIQVRRGGDGAVIDIGFVDGVLDVATLEDFVSGAGGNGDGFVRRWYDQSGNGRDVHKPAAPATNALQEPQIAAGGFVLKASNGNPAIRWDGVDDNLRAQAADGGANLIDHNDIFTIGEYFAQPANNPDNMRLYNFANTGSTRLSAGAEGISGGGKGEHAIYYNPPFNIGDSDVPIILNELFLTAMVVDGTSGTGNEFIRYDLNGVTLVDLTGISISQSHNQFILGAGTDTGGPAVLDGFLQEFLLFSGASNLSEADFNLITQDLLRTLQQEPVPEPSSIISWSFVVAGLVGVYALRKCK